MTTTNTLIKEKYRNLTDTHYITDDCIYKVLHYYFHEDLELNDTEAGEVYLLNLVSEQIERLTIWISDLEEESFYICLQAADNDIWNNLEDELEPYFLDELNMTYPANSPYLKDCTIISSTNQQQSIQVIASSLVEEISFFIDNPYQNTIHHTSNDNQKFSLTPIKYTINPKAIEMGYVGELTLDIQHPNKFTAQQKLPIFKGKFHYSVEIPFCECIKNKSNRNCSCAHKKLWFLHELNLPTKILNQFQTAHSVAI